MVEAFTPDVLSDDVPIEESNGIMEQSSVPIGVPRSTGVHACTTSKSSTLIQGHGPAYVLLHGAYEFPVSSSLQTSCNIISVRS